jgi:hypothetical protein
MSPNSPENGPIAMMATTRKNATGLLPQVKPASSFRQLSQLIPERQNDHAKEKSAFLHTSRALPIAILKLVESFFIICIGWAGRLHLLAWRLAALPSFLAVVAEVDLHHLVEIVHLADS